MKFYDISQELLSCNLFPGQQPPQHSYLEKLEHGDLCNISFVASNVHVGTHMDAPFHFEQDGADIANVSLEKVMGPAKVVCFTSDITDMDIKQATADGSVRLLFAGEGKLTLAAAQELVGCGVCLVGVTHQAVGLPEDIVQTHHVLLQNRIAIVEGLRLDHVPLGTYFLCAQPIAIAGGDGAPVRAVLINAQETFS